MAITRTLDLDGDLLLGSRMDSLKIDHTVAKANLSFNLIAFDPVIPLILAVRNLVDEVMISSFFHLWKK